MVLVLFARRAFLGSVGAVFETGDQRDSRQHDAVYLAFGFIPVAILVLVMKQVKFERSVKGISFSLGNGVLAGIGGLTLFAAYRSGGNTSVITAATALYPLITVVLAVLVLRERLNWLQMIGLGFAAAAIIIFSL